MIMRHYISSILILFFFCGNTMAQTVYPFQVLHAENATLTNGKSLKSLDIVSVEEIITVGADGYLALVHDTGFPIEVNKDTIVVILELHNAISPPNKTKRKKKSEVEVQRFDKGIGLDFLFISDKIIANKTRLNRTGMCMDCDTSLEIIYPPFSFNYVLFSNDLCLEWAPSKINNYSIALKDLYGDVLKEFKVDRNKTKFSFDEINDLLGIESAIVFDLNDSESQYHSASVLIKRFASSDLDFPYSCSIKSPAAALLVGYSLEKSPRNYSIMAEEYYKLATQLSSKTFYQDMLDNYYARQGK